MLSHKPPRTQYPDVGLFLVLIPFISAFNYYLTYTNIQFNSFLLFRFTIDTLQGYAAWLGMRGIVLLLDRRLPYDRGHGHRILVQLALTTLAGIAIISLTTEFLSLIVKGEPAPVSFYTFDLFIISIWFLVVNGIYVGLHYFIGYRSAEDARREQTRLKAGGLIARTGKQEILIPFDDILGLFVEEDYVAVTAKDGRRYLLDQSLDKLEEILPVTWFFRLNRQCIVHRQLVAGFDRAENGKINVLLTARDGIPVRVAVSRTKSPSFKEWFRPG